MKKTMIVLALVILTRINGEHIDALACIRRGDDLQLFLAGGGRVTLPVASVARVEHEGNVRDACAAVPFLCQDRSLRSAVERSYSADFLQQTRPTGAQR